MASPLVPPNNCVTTASHACSGSTTLTFRDAGAHAQLVVILLLLVLVLAAWSSLTRESEEHIGN